jgi:hypothetical protein
MPKQSRPLVDILFDLPQQPLVATPTGNNDDISFYNGSSPLMKIEGNSVSNSQVQTALELLDAWVSDHAELNARLEREPGQAACAPVSHQTIVDVPTP